MPARASRSPPNCDDSMLRPRAPAWRQGPVRDLMTPPYANERTARTIATMMSTNRGTTTGGTNQLFMFRSAGKESPWHAPARPSAFRIRCARRVQRSEGRELIVCLAVDGIHGQGSFELLRIDDRD